MRKKEFQCYNCGKRFVVEVLEPGEAVEKTIRPVPVSCPKCRSTKVKER